MNNYYSQNAENCIVWISELYEIKFIMKTFYVHMPSFSIFNCMLIVILSLLLIIRPIEMKFCVHLKQMRPYLDIIIVTTEPWIGILQFKFFRNICNYSTANFKRLSCIVLYKEINVQWILGLNLWKIHRSVLVLWNFEFFEESAVSLSSAKFKFSTKYFLKIVYRI